MQELPFVSVMADSSLTVPLTELARLYSYNTGITVNVTYDSSLELASQIEKGEQTDVFISASDFAIVMLKRKKLLDIQSITEIATNKLALISSVDNMQAEMMEADVSPWQCLFTVSNRAILVIGDPDTTPLGAYTREMIQNLGLWEKIRPISIRAENARIALYLIAQGQKVGVTYYSDAVNNKEVKVIFIFPQKLYSPIIYKAVAVESRENLLATQFIEFLASSDAQKILKKEGFGVK